jgi:hypothetical protein
VGILEGLTSPISCLALRQFYKGSGVFVCTPIAAAGSATGTLQILNLRSNITEAEFLVSKHRLRAVRWLNQHTVLTYTCEEMEGADLGYWKNGLILVDIRTGKTRFIRDDKGLESNFIRTIELSYSRKFFIILLRNLPMEIWDAQTLTLLRTIKLDSEIIGLFCFFIERK